MTPAHISLSFFVHFDFPGLEFNGWFRVISWIFWLLGNTRSILKFYQAYTCLGLAWRSWPAFIGCSSKNSFQGLSCGILWVILCPWVSTSPCWWWFRWGQWRFPVWSRVAWLLSVGGKNLFLAHRERVFPWRGTCCSRILLSCQVLSGPLRQALVMAAPSCFVPLISQCLLVWKQSQAQW